MHGTGTSIKSGEVKLVLWVQHVYNLYWHWEGNVLFYFGQLHKCDNNRRTTDHLLNILKLGVLPIQYLALYCLFLIIMTLLITLNLWLDYLQLILSYSSYSYHTSYFETNINSDLVKINDWANTWLIKFNPNMFFFLFQIHFLVIILTCIVKTL